MPVETPDPARRQSHSTPPTSSKTSGSALKLSVDRSTVLWVMGLLGFGAAGVAGGGGVASAFTPDLDEIADRIQAIERNQIRICVALKIECES